MRNSCPTRSTSSVVTPGAMTAAAASMACAASRPATRIRSMVSASLTSGPSSRLGAGRSTYSGRAMDAGTGRRGDTTPGATLAYVIGIRWSLGTSDDPSTWRAWRALMAYWYNLTTGAVENDENKSQSDDLMGPYGSEAQAAKALE